MSECDSKFSDADQFLCGGIESNDKLAIILRHTVVPVRFNFIDTASF